MPKRLLIVVGIIVMLGTGLPGQGVAARQGATVITPANVTQLVELARLGQGTINQLALSPDGTTIAVGSTLGVWFHDAADITIAPTLIETPDVSSVVYTPDGTHLITSSGSGTVIVWNVSDGTPANQLENPDFVVNTLRLSPDGQLIALSGQDGTIHLWHIASGDVTIFTGHTDAVTDVAFSPDGSQLVSISRDLTVRVWDIATATELSNFPITDDKGLASLAISPDGSLFIIGGEEAGIHIMDAATGEVLAVLTGHIGQINRLAFSPDGRVLASGGADQSIRLWNVETLAEDAQLMGHTDWIRGLAFSPDGTQLYSASWDNSVRVWDIATATQLQITQGYTGRVVAIAFSPDGQSLASADASIAGLLRVGSSNVRLWDLTTNTERFHFEEHDSLARVFFGPEGDAIASASNDGILRQWAVADGRDLGYGSGTLMAFNKDWSKALFRVGDNSVIQVVDLDNTVEGNRQILYGHTDIVNVATMDAVDLLIATGGRDGSVRLWDAKNAQQISAYPVGGQGRSVAFNPDSSLLAAGDSEGVVHVWSVDTDEEVLHLEGHTGSVESVVFSPDGSLLVSTGVDSTVRIWNVSTGQQLAVLNHTVGLVAQASFNADGTILATCGDDGTIRLWGLK